MPSTRKDPGYCSWSPTNRAAALSCHISRSNLARISSCQSARRLTRRHNATASQSTMVCMWLPQVDRAQRYRYRKRHGTTSKSGFEVPGSSNRLSLFFAPTSWYLAKRSSDARSRNGTGCSRIQPTWSRSTRAPATHIVSSKPLVSTGAALTSRNGPDEHRRLGYVKVTVRCHLCSNGPWETRFPSVGVDVGFPPRRHGSRSRAGRFKGVEIWSNDRGRRYSHRVVRADGVTRTRRRNRREALSG